jgi:hypothetical protein
MFTGTEGQVGGGELSQTGGEKNREEALVERGHPPMDDLYKLADSLGDPALLNDPEIQATILHLETCEFCANGLAAYIYEQQLDESPALSGQDWWQKYK